MEKEYLRREYIRLANLNSIDDCLDLFDLFLEYFWTVIDVQKGDELISEANKDAVILNQMIFSKLLHLKKVVEGVSYSSMNGDSLNSIIDPTIVALLTRNIFETVSVFNLIFRNSRTDDEKKITYGLWVSSGLKYRQRFHSAATTPENINKLEQERIQIIEIEKEIKDTTLYLSLDEKNRGKIDELLKQKDYKVKFDGSKAVFLSWQDMCILMGLNNDIFENMYTYFSLYTHPSEVSVFQFESMFSKEREEFKQLTATILKYCFSLVSVFIADYIHLFPHIQVTFEKQAVYNQIALNAHNKMLRGDTYSINDAWKQLE